MLKWSMVSDGVVVRVRDSSAESGRRATVDVELLIEGQRVSSCRIVPLSLRFGTAVVRMDGIADVKTAEAYRYRGFSRRVLTRALQVMEESDAALTMLYGITDFYPKFRYITVGPEATIALPPLDEEPVLPRGYTARPFREAHLPAVRRLYDQLTAYSSGAAVRLPDEYPWTAMLQGPDCRVVTDIDGEVVAYVWRGEKLTFVRAHSRYNPHDLVLAEVVAVEPDAADAALLVARRWGGEEVERRGQAVGRVLFFTPHEGPVTAAAMQTEATLSSGYGPDGGWMARVLSPGRLLSSLQPELSRRWAEGHSGFRGILRIVTETGHATLQIDRDDADGRFVRTSAILPGDGEALVCRLPQTVLARLAVGSFPPDDLLARLPDPPDEMVRELLGILFPQRPAQLFLADRF